MKHSDHSYYTYKQPESAEEAIKEARLLFRKMDIYISSDLQEDIRDARKMYEKLRQSQY